MALFVFQRNRTPLHLCVCLKNRHKIWPILQDGGADQNLIDAVSYFLQPIQRINPLPAITTIVVFNSF